MRYPPIFVLGAPRSGTTLLGQVMSEGLDVCFFPQRAIHLSRYFGRFPPLVLLTRLAMLQLPGTADRNSFESTYGKAANPLASTDSDPMWVRVLPDGFLDAGDVDSSTRRFVARVFAQLERAFDKPVLDKSVGHSLRIGALSEIFPDAIFVRTRRDPLQVAQSVWIGRRDHPERRWPTPKVRGYEKLQWRSLEEQAVNQQFLFDADIDAGLKNVATNRVVDVSFSDLCSDPYSVLRDIADTAARLGVEIALRLDRVPKNFKSNRELRIPTDAYASIVGYLEQMPDCTYLPLERCSQTPHS